MSTNAAIQDSTAPADGTSLPTNETHEIVPLQDRVLVRPDVIVEKRSSGVIVPASVQKRPVYGTVAKVGPGWYQGGTFVPTTIQVGDRVLYGQYSGVDVEGLDEGDKFVCLKESEILYVVRPKT